jgi:hypothetical protein
VIYEKIVLKSSIIVDEILKFDSIKFSGGEVQAV